jgi:hypothetical protein
MNNPFELKEGKLVFEEDKIIISDNAKSQRNYWLFLSGLQVLCGVMMVLRFLKNGEQVFLWTGLFLSVVNFVIFVGFLLRSVRSEINLREVKSMKLKENFGNDFLDIKLQSNRIRRVNQISIAQDLREYLHAKWKIN